jgi:hypothetical protein
MPNARPAAEIDPVWSIASNNSALPGPMAISSPKKIWALSFKRADAGASLMDGD